MWERFGSEADRPENVSGETPAAQRAALTLEEIREKFCTPVETDVFPLQPQSVTTGSEFIPGIPRGALTEVSGSGKTEWISRFLANHSQLWTAWVDADLSVFPVGLAQRQVNLERLLFVNAAEAGQRVQESGTGPGVAPETELEWCVLQLLASRLFPIVILSGERLGPFSDRGLRRIEVAARQARAAVMMVSQTPSEVAWPFALRLKLEMGRLKVLKSRRGVVGN